MARLEIENLKASSDLEQQRAKELETVIAAEREAKSALLDKIEIQKDRISTLEKRLGRERKLLLFVGGIAVVGIVIAVGK